MGEKRAEVEVTKPGCLRLLYGGKTVVLERDRFFIPNAEDRIEEALPQGYEDELATRALKSLQKLLDAGHHWEAYDSTKWKKYQEDLSEPARLLSRSIVCENHCVLGIRLTRKPFRRNSHFSGTLLGPFP